MGLNSWLISILQTSKKKSICWGLLNLHRNCISSANEIDHRSLSHPIGDSYHYTYNTTIILCLCCHSRSSTTIYLPLWIGIFVCISKLGISLCKYVHIKFKVGLLLWSMECMHIYIWSATYQHRPTYRILADILLFADDCFQNPIHTQRKYLECWCWSIAIGNIIYWMNLTLSLNVECTFEIESMLIYLHWIERHSSVNQ